MIEHQTDTVALVVFCAMFALVTVMGFVAARWRRGDMKQLNEWGLGGKRFGTVVTWFLLGGDIYTAYTFIAVPALLYGIGGGGLLRLALHDHRLPDRVRPDGADVVGGQLQGLRDPGRLRARALRQPRPGAGGGLHRAAGDHALHRAAAGRPAGGDRGDGSPGRPADHRRLPDPGRLHVQQWSARPRADLTGQGHRDLRHRAGGGDLHPHQAGRLRRDLRRRRRGSAHQADASGGAGLAGAGSAGRARRPMPRWPWARRWPCSATRT